MALSTKPLNQILTYSRATGATRFNSSGVLVGIDFSATSNTIASTGAFTFILAATAAVNRSFAVGDTVLITDQTAGGTMTGTVASYTPSTQVITITVTASTGSGTSTNWRIGNTTLRFDYDPVALSLKGVLVEASDTNLVLQSQNFTNAYWTAGVDASLTSLSVILPDGTTGGTKFAEAATTAAHAFSSTGNAFTSVLGGTYTLSVIAKKGTGATAPDWVQVSFPSAAFGSSQLANFNLTTGLVGNVIGGVAAIQPLGNGFYKLSFSAVATAAAATPSTVLGFTNNINTSLRRPTYLGQTTSDVIVFATQLSTSAVSSYIPTTTVAITRAADIPLVGGAPFSGAYNQAQGTLIIEAIPTQGIKQSTLVSASDGTANNAVRISQRQAGTLSSIRSIASDGVTDVMALNAGVNTLVGNGLNLTETGSGDATGYFGSASAVLGSFLAGGTGESFASSGNSGFSSTVRSIKGTTGKPAYSSIGGGQFIVPSGASTGLGSLLTSPDGVSWTRINTSATTQNLNKVISNGANLFVAVGQSGAIITSPDGVTWTAQTSGTAQNLLGGTFAAGVFVVVGAAGVILTSTDGVTWTSRTSGTALTLNDVAYDGSSQFIAVGNTGAVISSPAGTTWTTQTSGTTNQLFGIVFASSTWIAVGAAGTVISSANGTAWVTQTSGTANQLNQVLFFNSLFIAVGSGTTVITSTLGVSWATQTTNLSGSLNGIAASGTLALATGTSGVLATSSNGTSYANAGGGNSNLSSIAFGAGTYVLGGNATNGSALLATVNPTTYAYKRQVSGTVNPIYAVAFVNGQFVATSASGTILKSPDGVTWTAATPISGALVNSVTFGTGLYVFCENSGTNGRIFSSPDLVTYTLRQTLPTAVNGVVAFGNSLFVAVFAGGSIYSSTNGTAWTAQTSGVTVNLNAVRYSTRDSLWYAAGDSGMILTSPDAVTWASLTNRAAAADIVAGSPVANPMLPSLNPGVVNKIAMRIQAGNFGVSVNGSAAVDTASGTLGNFTQLSIGMASDQSLAANCWIRKVTYNASALTDAQLVSAST
jgi:hypothetical protein